MNIKWRNDLTTGDHHIDRQHHQLFEKIDGLIEACKEKRAHSEISVLLGFLKGYVREHFEAEEQYQAQHGYPCHLQHKEQHRLLLRQLDTLEREFMVGGVSLPVITNSLKLTYEWLTNHILLADLDMAQHLQGALH
jgi:hemerythrin